MMIKLGIIGLGTIFKKHLAALHELPDKYSLCGVYDISKTALDALKQLSPATDCYQNISDFLANKEIQAVLIGTPPQSHFSLAKQCLESKKHVLLEKPAVLSFKELEALYDIAKKNNRILHIAYHAAFAVDLIWFLNNKPLLESKYNLGKCQKITCHFYDPYIIDKELINSRNILGGSFLDSGVNALSVCNQLADLSHAHLSQHSIQCVEDLVISSYTKYTTDEHIIEIYTSWNKNINQKKTILTYDNNSSIVLEHTLQTVELLQNGNCLQLSPQILDDRLTLQYKGVFEDFYAVYHNHICSNREASFYIHKLLLET